MAEKEEKGFETPAEAVAFITGKIREQAGLRVLPLMTWR